MAETSAPAVVSGRSLVGLDPQWGGHGGIYGGRVIAALGAAAVGGGTDDYDLLSLHVEFSGAVQAGEVELEVTEQHRGRVSASVAVVLCQGHDRARAQAKLARVGAGEHEWRLPLPDGVPAAAELAAFEPAYWHRLAHCRLLELRLVEHRALDTARTTRLWVRLDETRPEVAELDHAGRIACLVDAVPPALFFADPAPLFVPTLDLTLHLRPGVALPDDGWCYAEGRLVWASAEFCLEEVTLWSSSGELLAQGRQNRRVVYPD